jgi:transcriptional regulator with XRE-family HTH domain
MLMKEKRLLQEAGVKLKKLREQLNYSPKEMGARLGVTRTAYWKNENGRAFPGYQSLKRLSDDYDISMDWFIFNKGPKYYKEKEREKELEELKKELEMEKMKNAELEAEGETGADENETSAEEKAAGMEMNPEVKELLAHMERIPVLYHEVMLHFHKFKIESKELVEASMAPDTRDTKVRPEKPKKSKKRRPKNEPS